MLSACFEASTNTTSLVADFMQSPCLPLGLASTEGLGLTVCHERTMDEKGGYSSVRCFAKDGGRPSGVGLQEQAPNRHELLG